MKQAGGGRLFELDPSIQGAIRRLVEGVNGLHAALKGARPDDLQLLRSVLERKAASDSDPIIEALAEAVRELQWQRSGAARLLRS